MGNGWTPERRQQQAVAIKRWKPWQQSTGPRTNEGKVAASRNAWKGGHRPLFRAMAEAMRGQREWLDGVGE